MRLITLRVDEPGGGTRLLGRYPAPDPPHLGALWGVVCSDDLPMYVVEDGDGTRWLVSDLTDWYLNGRADRILREES